MLLHLLSGENNLLRQNNNISQIFIYRSHTLNHQWKQQRFQFFCYKHLKIRKNISVETKLYTISKRSIVWKFSKNFIIQKHSNKMICAHLTLYCLTFYDPYTLFGTYSSHTLRPHCPILNSLFITLETSIAIYTSNNFKNEKKFVHPRRSTY